MTTFPTIGLLLKMLTTLLTNVPISAPVTSAPVTVNATLQHASFDISITSPNIPNAAMRFQVQMSNDNGVTWFPAGDFGLQNAPANTVSRHGDLIPIVVTSRIVFEMPGNSLGERVRVAVVSIQGTWTIVAAVMNT
jgi:hypothetical protein